MQNPNLRPLPAETLTRNPNPNPNPKPYTLRSAGHSNRPKMYINWVGT